MNLCLSKKKYHKEAMLTAWTHEIYSTANYSGGFAQSTTAPTTNNYKGMEDIHPTTPPATSIGSIVRRMCVRSIFGTNANTPHSPGTHMIGMNTSCVTTQEEHSLYILTESSRQDTGQKYQTA